MNVTVECSRCRSRIDGIIDDGVTGGFYDTKEGSGWELFADVGEEVICDGCMHNDYRYQSVYGGEKIIEINALLDLCIGGLTASFTETIDCVHVVEISDHCHAYSEHVAAGKGHTRASAINHAYLQYLRWMDKRIPRRDAE